MTTEIKGFFGKYRWLSNFWYAPVMFEGILYPTNEHAYQAAKTLNPITRAAAVAIDTPINAKHWGKNISLRADWEIVKRDIMKSIVVDKFNRHKHLSLWLLATKEAYLEETNTWGDVYWGVSGGLGSNHLGIILMEVRSELAIRLKV